MRKKSKASLTVDFTDAEERGSYSIPEGTYVFVVKEVSEEVGQDSGAPYLKWVVSVASGPHKGTVLYENTSLKPKALWKLRDLLQAMGEQVPKGKMELSPLSQFVGSKFSASVADEEYDGKVRSRILEYVGAAEEAGDKEEVEGIRVGSKVSFVEDKKRYKGVVTSIDGDLANVEVDGEDWELEIGDLTEL